MGAGGFIMAELTGVPYSKIMLVAIFPAVMYVFSVFIMVHYEAKKHNIKGEKSEHSAMEISKLDHLVLTVKDFEITTSFYVAVMGMKKEVFDNGRVALKYGSQKINLHEFGKEFEPKANKPMPGSADLCFITQTPLNDAMAHVKSCGVEIIEGPVERTGANGPIRSFYFRDPDHNLIEVANEI